MKRSYDEVDNDYDSLSHTPDSPSATPENSSESVKIVHLSEEAAPPARVIHCSLPGHAELSFSSYDEYERHYSQSHMWKCSECRRNFPSEHYLGLHIEEFHDSMFSVRKERGDRCIYSCFVKDCDRKCSTPHKRQLHLIQKHMFRKDFDFQIIRTGIDHRSSMLKSGRHIRQNNQQQRGTARATHENLIGPKKPTDEREDVDAAQSELEEKMQVDNETEARSTLPSPSTQPDTEMKDLAEAMSSLKFIPTSVRFGRGGGRPKGRGGFSKG